MNYFSSINQELIKSFLTLQGYSDIRVEEDTLHTSFIFVKGDIEFTFELCVDDDTASEIHELTWSSLTNGRLFNYQNPRWHDNMDSTFALAAIKRRLNKFNKLENKWR
jgi:hypothetical protein